MKYTFPVFLCGANMAFAHHGHAEAAAGNIHWLTTGDHLIVVVLGAVALGLGARMLIRALAKRPAPQERAK